jgi:aminopeptidase N
MRRFLFIYGFIAFATCCAFVLTASSQAAKFDFNRNHDFDVQNYRIQVSFDRAKKEVFGDTTISFKPLRDGMRSIEFDAVELAIGSVALEPSSTPLQFRNTKRTVTVTLDKPYGPEDVVSVRFKYKAKPVKGIYFVDADSGHSAQIWTQGEPDEARHWFPSFDFPSDKATTEQIITADKDDTVVGNGELIAKTQNADGTQSWHYRMNVPHSTYLVSFVIGKYELVAERYKDVALGYYVYPGKEKTARNAYERTADMLKVFEELTGIGYPYNKYDQTIVANFQFGGMENITATTMADTEIFFADSDIGKYAVMDLVSHELAHSWFGNLVTCRNWAELWLNEGFATFMEAAYREKAFSREDYQAKIRRDAATYLVDDTINGKRHGLYNQRAGNVASLFDNPATTYNKGGVVLHMLREQVGNNNFWKAVNAYLIKHRLGNVESTDLQKAMEAVSGQDLKWFFDQWVYGVGAPKLDIRKTYSASSKTLRLTVTQNQKPVEMVPSTFKLPLDVEIITSSGKRSEKIEVKRRMETFSFPVDASPTEVNLDPNERIPLKTVNDRKLQRLP